MALSATTIWEVNTLATSGNVNGGGFNYGNPYFLTDLVASNADTAYPEVSSSSYNFQTNDIGHWLYIKTGTDWYRGFYQIASVSANKATINATVGSAYQNINSNTSIVDFDISTLIGCASTNTTTGGVFSIDYSRGVSAVYTGIDLSSVSGSASPGIVTSTSHSFTGTEIGNIIHITTDTSWLPGWYEIVSVSAGNATLDRAISVSSTPVSGGTYYIGGALSTIASAVPLTVAGNRCFIKAGTYTITSPIQFNLLTGNILQQRVFAGYNTNRIITNTDTRPVITTAVTGVDLTNINGCNWLQWSNLEFTSSAPVKLYAIRPIGTASSGFRIYRCKFGDVTDSLAGAASFTTQAADIYFFDCEMCYCTGSALYLYSNRTVELVRCWVHDNAGAGIEMVNTANSFVCYSDDTVFSNNQRGIYLNGSTRPYGFVVNRCTFYNNTLFAIQNTITSGNGNVYALTNSIIYGAGVNSNVYFNGAGYDVYAIVENNAFGGSGAFSNYNFKTGNNAVILTENPFVDSSNNDFRLNTSTGGGSLCKNIGASVGSLTMSLALGALGTQGGAGGGGFTFSS